MRLAGSVEGLRQNGKILGSRVNTEVLRISPTKNLGHHQIEARK